MSTTTFTLEGAENIHRIMQEFPEEGYRKPVISSFRKAARPVSNAMAARLPVNLKGMKRIIKIKPGKGKSLTLAVGFYGRQSMYRNSRGQLWDPWQLVYWFNYGTLANRLRSHQFKSPRKKKTASWNGGIRPGLFVEEAWETSKANAQRIFEQEMDKQVCKLYDKYALK